MEKTEERRREERLRYQWPVWFSEDFKQSVSEGLMVDVASGGIAFTCKAEDNCPHAGQRLVTRFSIPSFTDDNSSAMRSFTRAGSVVRIDTLKGNLCRVAIQFEEPLSLKPCEQASVALLQSKSPK